MSAREDATVAEILTWVTAVIGTAHGINQTHEGLTIVRNMIGQVAIWEGWATPAPHLVFAEDTGILLRYQPGPWVGQLAALAAEPLDAGEGGMSAHHRLQDVREVCTLTGDPGCRGWPAGADHPRIPCVWGEEAIEACQCGWRGVYGESYADHLDAVTEEAEEQGEGAA